MAILYVIGLAGSIFLAATNDPQSFWFAWGIACGIANLALLIREAAS